MAALLSLISGAFAQRTFTVKNNCSQTVWVGAFSSNQPQPNSGGWALAAGASSSVAIANGWNGRFWGRRNCTFDASGAGMCETGDCGRGLLCNGATGIAGTSLAEFTLNGGGAQDFYDVSLVDGYDFPISITPSVSTCGNPTCTSDVIPNCPASLQVHDNAGRLTQCLSACTVYNTDQYCCRGAYNSAPLCNPTTWPNPPGNLALPFQNACANQYAYAYDDLAATFTCPNTTTVNYTITFCPNGIGASDGQGNGTPPSTPTGLAATAGDGDVILTWNPASLAVSYNIYRSTTAGGEGSTPIATGVRTTSFVDAGLTDGTTYFYNITAINASTIGTSSHSSEVSSKPAAGLPKTIVDNLNDFTLTSTKTANWATDTTNTAFFNGDSARATRSADTTESLTYTLSKISNFTGFVWSYSTNVSGVTFSVSTNSGSTYSTIATTTGTPISGSAGWRMVTFNPTSALPANVTNLRVQFAPGTGNAWDPQLGQLNITYAGGTVTTPSAPTNLAATAGNAQVALTWTASSGATSYNIYRSTTTGTETSIATGVTSASYTNTGLTNGTKYFYKVAAVNSAGTSALSSEVSATPVAPTPPATPTNLVATAGNAQIGLTWTASSGATSYNVYRSTTTGTETSIATGVTSASYTNTGLTNGTKYFYKVAAVNAAGTSAQTAEVSAIPVAGVPATPANVVATAGNAQVGLTWSASSGATSYNVYRSTTTGTETSIATGVTSASYTNTGLTNGTKYFYKVAAVNTGGTSALSAEVSAIPAAPTVPATPTGLAATAGNAQVALSWSTSSGATSYNVYRSTTTGTETSIATGVTTASYTNTGLTNGTKYFYKVAAVNAAGTSALSGEVSAIPAAAVGGPISINCGGAASSPFVADVDFSGGATSTTTSAINTSLLSAPIPAQAVLQSNRHGAMTYTLTGFTAGTGHVIGLYFVENSWTAAGKRVFNVAINGTQVLTNFDIYANVNAQFKAIQENFNATANASGQIVITFTAVTDNPIIQGITAN